MDMPIGSLSRPDPDYWAKLMNDRAAELGLERSVKMVRSREIGEVMSWAYEASDGVLVDLGWNVEQAEAALRDIAGS